MTSSQVAYLTGPRSSPVTYKSRSNVMLVRLVTDSSDVRQGFNATYRTGKKQLPLFHQKYAGNFKNFFKLLN